MVLLNPGSTALDLLGKWSLLPLVNGISREMGNLSHFTSQASILAPTVQEPRGRVSFSVISSSAQNLAQGFFREKP